MKSQKLITHLSLPTLMLAAWMPTAQAAVIVSNAGIASNAGGLASTTGRIAVGFLSPSVGTEITSVTAVFQGGAGNPNLSMALFGDAGGFPGAAPLASLGSQSTTAAPTTLTFTPGAPVSLLASTQYFLVVNCTNCFPTSSVPGVTTNWLSSDPQVLGGLAGRA